MDYHLKINEEPITVSVIPGDEKTTRIAIGDRVYDVTGTRMNGHHLHMWVNGKGENVFVERNGSGKNIIIKGTCHTVDDMDHPTVSSRSRKKSSGIPDVVTPPMPSLVVAVLVAEGASVVKGQGLVVISAMKMETTLAAPYDGTVKEIRTAIGEKVNPGDVLVEVERFNNE